MIPKKRFKVGDYVRNTLADDMDIYTAVSVVTGVRVDAQTGMWLYYLNGSPFPTREMFVRPLTEEEQNFVTGMLQFEEDLMDFVEEAFEDGDV